MNDMIFPNCPQRYLRVYVLTSQVYVEYKKKTKKYSKYSSLAGVISCYQQKSKL